MSKRSTILDYHRLLCLTFCILLVASAGCTIKLISEYDETTDKAVTQLQRKMETFLVDIQRKVGTEEASYDKNAKVYDDLRVDISAILVRAQAIPKNEITVQQIKLFQESVANLEKLHQLGFSKPEELDPLRSAANITFTAILKLELAKKRGESAPTTK